LPLRRNVPTSRLGSPSSRHFATWTGACERSWRSAKQGAVARAAAADREDYTELRRYARQRAAAHSRCRRCRIHPAIRVKSVNRPAPDAVFVSGRHGLPAVAGDKAISGQRHYAPDLYIRQGLAHDRNVSWRRTEAQDAQGQPGRLSRSGQQDHHRGRRRRALRGHPLQ
jgi:hypothetical protein